NSRGRSSPFSVYPTSTNTWTRSSSSCSRFVSRDTWGLPLSSSLMVSEGRSLVPRLYMKEDGSFVGTIEESDLKVLVDQLEEEDESDDDYFIDEPTIDLLEENGASEALVSMLRAAVDGGDGVEIFWKK